VYLALDSGASSITLGHYHAPTNTAVAHSEAFDTLAELEQIGTRRSFQPGSEIYIDGDVADCWYRVVSGAVRICKLLTDGRRHIGQFCFAGDLFGLPATGTRAVSAEAIGDAIVMRFPQRAADHLIVKNPSLARQFYDRALQEIANAQKRTLLLGRMQASERVASFLIEMDDRQDPCPILYLPMTRSDIADYLGLTIETVCRELSSFKREGVIASSKSRPDRIELRDRNALEVHCEGGRRQLNF
jgi:CRP/FNR family transcriptional regulator, nitrogen fixation regulation protein